MSHNHHRHHHRRRPCLSSSLVWVTLVSLLILQPTVGAASSKPSLTRNQEKVNHAWNHLVDDFDQFQNLFADDAKIKMCLQGMPFCTEGTFSEMLEGFRVAFTKFHVKHKFLTGSRSSHEDTFLVEWVNSITTTDACEAMWWGYATYEFNDHGKIQRFVGLSDDSEDVIQCVSKVSGIHAEL